MNETKGIFRQGGRDAECSEGVLPHPKPAGTLREQEAIDGSKHYDPNVSKYSQGKQVGYVRGFNAGAEFALSHQWISIDEALPDDNEIALFIDQYGSMQLLTMNDIRAQNKILDAMLMGVPRGLLDESIVLLDKIVAWMPIPELNLK